MVLAEDDRSLSRITCCPEKNGRKMWFDVIIGQEDCLYYVTGKKEEVTRQNPCSAT